MKFQNPFLRPALLASLASALLLTRPAHAQSAAPKSDTAPAAVVQEPYRSAFVGYQPYTDDKMTDWKAANDTTARIGGWREYAKQAQQPDNTPAVLPTAAAGAASAAAPQAKP